MSQIGVIRHTGFVPLHASLVRRLAGKLMVDVVPAAAASLVVGCLLSQYQHGPAVAPSAQNGPASAEMMQLVRDDHAAIIDYLKAQTAAEKERYAAEDAADARAVASTKAAADFEAADATAETSSPPSHAATAVIATAVEPMHAKARVNVAAVSPPPPQTPLVIVQAQTDSVTPTPGAAPGSGSLLAKTIAVKNHVVHATLHMVSAIGGIPNWIASMGDRVGSPESTSQVRQFSSS
jgi:hypothetical protein